jgi:hypothetical protein
MKQSSCFLMEIEEHIGLMWAWCQIFMRSTLAAMSCGLQLQQCDML